MKFIFFLFLSLFCFGTNVQAASDSQLDAKARTLPLEQGQTIEDVVKNLIQVGYTDQEKARVLASFVAYQVQKNGYALLESKKAAMNNREAKVVSTGDILKTRLGTSFDYAELYQQLCAAAGLKAVVINGYAGVNVRRPNQSNPKLEVVKHALQQNGVIPNYDMQQYEAAWNAVYVDDQWILVDTYWMSGRDKAFVGREMTNPRDMNRFLKQRALHQPSLSDLTRNKTIDNDFFNAKPRTFVKTHYPFDSAWQLLPVPVTLSSFLK